MSIGTVTRYQGDTLSDIAVSQNLIYQSVQLGVLFFFPFLCACWCNICLKICSGELSKLHKANKSDLSIGNRSRYALKGRRVQHPVVMQAQEGKSED